ncbi:single Ig IL-1-related receptor isoform X2 [Chlorocebus sabaeus]|uniref:single Ig IL-1-related receptor isoform X2 n=1 Tax=Chlorocebus sabaeus TaxID=60711 RepID=UPI003BF9E524
MVTPRPVHRAAAQPGLRRWRLTAGPMLEALLPLPAGVPWALLCLLPDLQCGENLLEGLPRAHFKEGLVPGSVGEGMLSRPALYDPEPKVHHHPRLSAGTQEGPSRAETQAADCKDREESCPALGSVCSAKEPGGAGGDPGVQPAPRRPWLSTMPGVCDRAPDFLSPSEDQVLRPALGSSVALNCTAWVVSGPHCSLPSVQWLKDGLPLGNGGHYSLHEYSWPYKPRGCGAGLPPGPAGPAAGCPALCQVPSQRAALVPGRVWGGGDERCVGPAWTRDGKLYDAYVSYSDCPEDRKFVNFILKPQLERRRGYKLFLDDRDLLPRAEPSADLLVNLSRCRRLIVVLSDAFLSRAWCSHSFREGLCRLLELTRRPIFITFEGQRRDPAHPALRLLRQHRHLVTLLLWRPGSVTPSSDFWKELQLALPRKVHYRPVEGDPQTQLQDDKDPMLILRGRVPEGRALDSEVDPDPEGDLGVRGPVFGEPSAPLHTSGVSLGEGRSSEVDVSDLGSRNYSARTDFYCLVSKDDM